MTWKTNEEQAEARKQAVLSSFVEKEAKKLPSVTKFAPVVQEAMRLVDTRTKELGLHPYYGPACVALCAAEAACAMLEAEVLAKARLNGLSGTSLDGAVQVAESLTGAIRQMVKDTYSGAREDMVEAFLEANERKEQTDD